MKACILQHDRFETEDASDGVLDGSVAAMQRLLRELCDMTGEGRGCQGVPVLELQFDDIVTKTSLLTKDAAPYLLITALLPRHPHITALLSATEQLIPAGQRTTGVEYVWHSDEGHYVVVRKIPLAQLPDERSVMDAILDAATLAKDWFAALGEKCAKAG